LGVDRETNNSEVDPCGMTDKRTGNGKSQSRWKVLHSHLSDDETVANMGHPIIWAEMTDGDEAWWWAYTS
jgi:hypothetical protein